MALLKALVAVVGGGSARIDRLVALRALPVRVAHARVRPQLIFAGTVIAARRRRTLVVLGLAVFSMPPCSAHTLICVDGVYAYAG